jgi:YgiT-type zinc finger domain-containing protein
MKRQNKTSGHGSQAKPQGELCPMCGKGTTHIVKLDYTLKDENGREFVVSDLEVEICNFCGEKFSIRKPCAKQNGFRTVLEKS